MNILPKQKIDQLLIDSLEFYAETLLPGEHHKINLYLEIGGRDPYKKFLSYGNKAYLTVNNKGYNLFMRANLPLKQQLIIMAHETVHLEQNHTKRLATLGNTLCFWEGELFVLTDDNYSKRPWEIEAFAKQDELYNQFVESKRISK